MAAAVFVVKRKFLIASVIVNEMDRIYCIEICIHSYYVWEFSLPIMNYLYCCLQTTKNVKHAKSRYKRINVLRTLNTKQKPSIILH